MIRRSAYWAALSELASLRRYCARTGELLEDLIEVPPDVRAGIDAFCVAHPEHAASILEAMEMRDLMLEKLSVVENLVRCA